MMSKFEFFLKGSKVLLVAGGFTAALVSYSPRAQAGTSVPLETVIAPRVVVTHPGQQTTVQPYAFLEFEADSCAQMPLTVKTLKSGTKMRVTVELPSDFVECEALPTRRTYSLQISSDFQAGTEVHVANPVPVVPHCDGQVASAFQAMVEAKGHQFNGAHRISATEALLAVLESHELSEQKKAEARQQFLNPQVRIFYSGIDNYMSGTGLTVLMVDPKDCEIKNSYQHYSE